MSPRARACTCARCRRLARARATRVGAKRHDGTVSAAAPRIVIAAGGTAGHVVPVLGGGGYVAAPVVLAARTLRVPVVLTEADAVIGLSNRLLAPLARSVCVAFDAAIARRRPRRRATARWPRRGERAQAHARNRYVVTGRPLLGYSSDRAGARERLGVAADETLL